MGRIALKNAKAAVPPKRGPRPKIREVEVPGQGVFRVPELISRVDSYKRGKANGRPRRGWHGWQLRWPGFSKFFSDTQHGTCASAFRAAVRYKREHYPGKRSQCHADVGVRTLWRTKKGKTVAECYVQASHPVKGVAARRFYVGTENTFRATKLNQCMREAKRWRREVIADHMVKTGTTVW